MDWQLQEAKNRLSHVVKEAREEGPQIITVRGEEAVVMLSMEEYQQLTQPQGDLVSFLEASPWAETDLDLSRDEDTGREVAL